MSEVPAWLEELAARGSAELERELDLGAGYFVTYDLRPVPLFPEGRWYPVPPRSELRARAARDEWQQQAWAAYTSSGPLLLDFGTLDLGIIRDSGPGRALLWSLARPWRWHLVPCYVWRLARG